MSKKASAKPDSDQGVEQKSASKSKSGEGMERITRPIDAEQEGVRPAAREVEDFAPVPEILYDDDGNRLPHWRIILEVDVDPPAVLGLDVYGPVTFGRADDDDEEAALFDLSSYDAEARGVSRRHLELRPAPHGLFAVDLGSTNGTQKNGVPLAPNSPTPVGSNDTLTLGLLHITVEIVDAPHQEAEWLARQATLGQALTEMAKTVTTRLKVEDVLNAAVDYAIGLTQAQEAILWLLKPEANELHLEAARGVEMGLVGNVTLPVEGSVAGEAVLTTKPVVRSRRSDLDKKVMISEGHEVDSVVFVPLALGGLCLGVLSVSNRTPGHDFTDYDLEMLASLADFAAIALQNSRTLQATDEALRESLRAQREATARALESTRLKTEFLATISHELRSPLHTINGFSEMILRGTFGEMPVELHDPMERINSNGKQLLEIVDNMLDSMRLEAKDLDLAHEEFSPRKLVGNVVASQKPLAMEKQLLLAWTAEGDVPALLMGDPNRVRQILLNLVSNALKFTQNGGVSVQIRTIGKHMWSVAVADTGPGVAPDDQEVIFERFRQADQSSTRSFGGVGLGLAISRELAHIMGGDLRVYSEGVPGKGSTFTLTLPLILPGEEYVPATTDGDTIRVGAKSKRTESAEDSEDEAPTE